MAEKNAAAAKPDDLTEEEVISSIGLCRGEPPVGAFPQVGQAGARSLLRRGRRLAPSYVVIPSLPGYGFSPLSGPGWGQPVPSCPGMGGADGPSRLPQVRDSGDRCRLGCCGDARHGRRRPGGRHPRFGCGGDHAVRAADRLGGSVRDRSRAGRAVQQLPAGRRGLAMGNITHWSQFDRGGHFAGMETPDLLVDDIRAFFRNLR